MSGKSDQKTRASVGSQLQAELNSAQMESVKRQKSKVLDFKSHEDTQSFDSPLDKKWLQMQQPVLEDDDENPET